MVSRKLPNPPPRVIGFQPTPPVKPTPPPTRVVYEGFGEKSAVRRAGKHPLIKLFWAMVIGTPLVLVFFLALGWLMTHVGGEALGAWTLILVLGTILGAILRDNIKWLP